MTSLGEKMINNVGPSKWRGSFSLKRGLVQWDGSTKKGERNSFCGIRGALKKNWFMNWGLNNGYEFVMWQNLVGGSERTSQAKVWIYQNIPNYWISITTQDLFIIFLFSHSLYYFPSCLVSDFLPKSFESSILLSIKIQDAWPNKE